MQQPQQQIVRGGKTCNNKSLHDTQGDKENNEGQNGLKKGSKGKKEPWLKQENKKKNKNKK